MPSAPLPQALSSLPLHSQLMLAVIVTSALLCLVVVLAGPLRRRWLRAEHDGLPPVPPAFPGLADQLYTALFISFVLYGAAANLFPSETSRESSALTWGTMLAAIATHIGLYLPMLVRYAMLHPWQKPAQPWWHFLLRLLLVWSGIYASIALVEGSGFSSWLIERTQCPEHQDLVTAFSRGDLMQKLYIGISAVLVAPIVEECCFRGFLYNTLKRHGGCVAAALASALLFGAIHSSLAQMLPLTLFGIGQCIAYEKSRTLWLPIAVHALFNSVSLLTTALILS